MEEIAIVERGMIRPSTPTTRQDLFLSNLDLAWFHFPYARLLLFYATPGGNSQQDAFISTLKASLAMLLVPFYPAAGRLAHSTHSDNRVCIDCNDAGVEFVVATAHSPHFNELQADNFQPRPFFNKLALHDVHSSSEIFNLPLLSIQVTKLGLEGLAMGFAHNHVLADGRSIVHLMNSWGECARMKLISMPPVHMRTALAVEEPSEERAVVHYPPKGLSVAENTAGPVRSKEPLKERHFRCSAEMIQKLKDEANSMASRCLGSEFGISGGNDRSVNGSNAIECAPEMDQINNRCKEEDTGKMYSFTSYEVLCAHWWKRLTQARGLEGKQAVMFGMLADMRSRLSPKLPPSYFGNAIVVEFIYASAAEILQESLAQTAARIHQASLSCSEEYMWAVLHWVELRGYTLDPKLLSDAPALKAVGSSRFRVYDIDYGHGRPIAVRPARTKDDGEMMLLASPDDHKGGVDICVPLTALAMENLLKDSSLGCL